MDPFGYEKLSFEEKQYLRSWALHPGYIVFKKLCEDACLQAGAKLIRLRPDDDKYDAKLKTYQLEAHVVNDVAATMIKSIAMHSEAAEQEEAIQKVQRELEEAGALTPSSTGFGSLKMKARKS